MSALEQLKELAREYATICAHPEVGITIQPWLDVLALIERHEKEREQAEELGVVWDDSTAPGGYVCALPDPDQPGERCGRPVESDPCDRHTSTGDGRG